MVMALRSLLQILLELLLVHYVSTTMWVLVSGNICSATVNVYVPYFDLL